MIKELHLPHFCAALNAFFMTVCEKLFAIIKSSQKDQKIFTFKTFFQCHKMEIFYFFCATFSQLAQEAVNAVEHKNEKKNYVIIIMLMSIVVEGSWTFCFLFMLLLNDNFDARTNVIIIVMKFKTFGLKMEFHKWD